MKIEDLVGYDVIRTQPIDLGVFVDTSYMHYPVHVNKVNTVAKTAVVSDFKSGYGAILGIEWLDDNWEKAGNINQYKEPEYDKLSHIIKKGEHPKTMQDIMSGAKAVTTNRVGDSKLFENANCISSGMEEATKDEAENFIKGLSVNGSDYDADYIKKESYNNDDLSDESMLNNMLDILDGIRSGKTNGQDADTLTRHLLIRKMDSMGVIPRSVNDTSLIELEFPSKFDCEDSMIALQMAVCAFGTFAQNIYLCSKTNPAYSVMITETENSDDDYYYGICGFNGSKVIGSDEYMVLDEFIEHKDIPKLVIYFQNNEDGLLANAMRLLNNGVKIIPDLTAILIADSTCVYDADMLMMAMAVQGERDALLCIANDKMYVINHNKDNKKISIEKYEGGVVGVLDMLREDSRYDSTGIAILRYDDAKSFDEFVDDIDNNGGHFYT